MTDLERLRAERELHGLAIELTATTAAPYWYPFRHAMIGRLIQHLADRFAAYEPRVDPTSIYKNPHCTLDHPGQSCNVACDYD